MIGVQQVKAYQTPEANGVYYLYNTACTDGAPGFMSSGNNYGFQVVIDNYGFPLKLISTGTENTYKFQFVHHNGYLSDDGFMFSDGDENRARTITVQAIGDGNYKLLNTNNGKEIEDWYGNVVGDGTGSRHNYLWQFLSKDERDAMIAGYTTSVKLAAAASMGMPANVDTEEKFDEYLSTNYIGIDQSAKITNGTFDTNHKTEGWTTYNNDNRTFNLGWGNVNPKTTPEVYEGAGYINHTTISVDKAGLYKVSVNATYRCGNDANNNRIGALGYDGSVAYLQANNNIAKLGDWYSGKINGNGPSNPSEANSVYFAAGKYLTEVYVYVGDAKTIDISLHSHAFTWGGWLMFNNFKLTYYSDAVSDEDANAIIAQAEAITGAMNAEVQTTLANALSTFKSARTIANYNALGEAMTAATNSVAAYAKAKAYLDEAATILAGTNVYTAEAYDTYYSTPLAKYNAGTLTTDEGNALVKTSTNHKSANTVNRILLSSWTIGGTQCQDFDTSLYINTWSTEGNTDGSKFLAPFFEYWVADDQCLAANNIVATVSGLKANATYSFTIRARVHQTNNQTKIANGVTMKVGNGEAVDISAGAQFNAGSFYIGNFSAVGETDAYGKLTMTMTVAENSNISWLSFYNAKWTEGEDLSAYIADYEFAKSTAIANRDNVAYAAVTGKERADLVNTITTYSDVDETSKAALIEAKEALETASNTFVAAAPAYTALAELNPSVAATLGVALPTITSETVAADLDVNGIIVAEYTAGKAYAQDFTTKLGEWTDAPGTNKGQSWNGTGDDTYYDEYNKTNRTMTQTVTLPKGDYALIAKGRASANGRLTLVVGSETVTFPHKSDVGRGIATDGAATFADNAIYANNNAGRGWEYRVMTFTSDGKTPITLTFNWRTASNNWCGLDDIVLLCNPAALDYSALQTAYDAVVVPTLGFEAGEYAPYNNKENLENISIAKNLLDNKDADNQEAIDNATAAITGMTWTANTEEVNAVYNGDFSLSANDGAPVGWVLTGATGTGNSNNTLGGQYRPRAFVLTSEAGNYAKLATFGQGDGTRSAFYIRFDDRTAKTAVFTYGNTEGYTMPLKTNTIYKLTAQAGGWGQTKDIKIAVVNGSDANVVAKAVTLENIDDGGSVSNYEMYFVVPEAGNYKLQITNASSSDNNAAAVSNIVLKSTETLAFADNATFAYAPGTYPSATYTRTILADSKYGTICLPFNVKSDKNITFYNLESVEGTTLNLTSADEGVAAGVPAVFKKLTADAEEISVTTANAEVVAAPVAQDGDTKLVGTFSNTNVSENVEKCYYIKSNAFWQGYGNFNVKAYRAYIQTGVNEARLIIKTDGEDPTAINAIEAAEAEEGALKDGKYLIDGKVILVKNGVKYSANGQKLN